MNVYVVLAPTVLFMRVSCIEVMTDAFATNARVSL